MSTLSGSEVLTDQFSQALSTQTVIGTRRFNQPLPHYAPLDAFLSALPNQNRPEQLLALLAAWSVYCRAGQQAVQAQIPAALSARIDNPQPPERVLPESLQKLLLACMGTVDSRLFCNDFLVLFWRNVAARVGGVLQGQSLLAVLKAGNQSGFRIPFAAHFGQRAELLASVMGESQWGGWAGGLATRLPDDLSVLDPTNLAVWQTGCISARELLFQRMRQADPTIALAHLQSVWPTEKAQARQFFMVVLKHDLTDADEPFLQSVLEQDRSQALRAQAAGLLSQLPNSRLMTRQRQRFQDWVSWDAKTKQPVFAEIEQIDAQMLQDGWDLDAKIQDGLGAKAQALRHFISLLPLDCWQQLFDQAGGVEPQDWLKKLQKSDWQDAVLLGLYYATIRQKNREWAALLLSSPLKFHHAKYLDLNIVPLLLLLDDAAQQVWCQAQIQAILPEQTHTQFQVFNAFCLLKLQQMAQPLLGFWSSELTEHVVACLIRYQNVKQRECNVLAQLLVCCANWDDLAQQQIELPSEARQAEHLRRQLLGYISVEVGR